MKEYLEKLHYGKMDVNPGNIDLFWLEGESRITTYEQLDFVKKLYREELPLCKKTMKELKQIMLIDSTEQYKMSGKTGWAIRDNNNYGWFVGYLETNGNAIFFSTLIQPKDNNNVKDFAIGRKTITMDVLRKIGFIH
jgi:beta-lactamase class D